MSTRDRSSSHMRDVVAARWSGRGASVQIRVDPDAARDLAAIPERDRRRVASAGIRSAVAAWRGAADPGGHPPGRV